MLSQSEPKVLYIPLSVSPLSFAPLLCVTLTTTMSTGYSGSDMKALCSEAARRPVRMLKNILEISADSVRPINLGDFESSLKYAGIHAELPPHAHGSPVCLVQCGTSKCIESGFGNVLGLEQAVR
jgi:SpoVK/Ycf46/Vps4 family AAA+-type ATPase